MLNFVTYHKLVKVQGIIDTINYQALALVKVVVLASHFKLQSLCKGEKNREWEEREIVHNEV